MKALQHWLKHYFELDSLGTNIRTELLAGLSTFLAAMYIVIVNPSVLHDGGMPFQGVLTGTVLVACLSSVLMGMYGKQPIVLAPGMGLNAFFTYTVLIQLNTPWQTALGAVFWSGVVNLLLSLLNVRVSILRGIPKSIRSGVAAGIGLFITLIGLKNAGWIVANPQTILTRGPLNAMTITFFIGLVLTAFFMVKRLSGAIVYGIALTTLIAYPIGRWWGDASSLGLGSQTLVNVGALWAWPDFSLLLQADIWGALRWPLMPVIFAMAFTDLFDSLSTFIGVAHAGNLLDEDGEPRRVRQVLFVDAIASMISGPLGSSAGTSYIESIAGVKAGGRSGLTAIVAGLLFLPFLFFSPLLSLVPALATAPVLVLVGILMMKTILTLEWDQLDEVIPAFIAMLFIPFAFSISQGLIWGFLSWTALKVLRGRYRDISPVLWGINLFCVLSLFHF